MRIAISLEGMPWVGAVGSDPVEKKDTMGSDLQSYRLDLRVLAGLFVPGAEVQVESFEDGGQTQDAHGGQTQEGITHRIRLVWDSDGVTASFENEDVFRDVLSCPRIRLLKVDHSDFIGKNLQKNMLKAAFFDLMSSRYVPRTGWGILTGIRPVKIVHDLLEVGMEDAIMIRDYLKRHYRVSDAKIQLALEVAQQERDVLDRDFDRLSIYICIPFCASRCLYCSFPSNPLNQKGHLVPAYLEALVGEIKTIGKALLEQGRRVDCVYIGGGTPTSLNASEFVMLLEAVDRWLVKPLSAEIGGLREYTVEAGRPDTITEAKLWAMKRHGVNRVCVNPQTMSDATLRRIGRSHDAAAVIEAFEMVRRIGFEVVNADLIVGLPGETLDEVAQTAAVIRDLRPENVTVHTLAVKRASKLNEERGAYESGLVSAEGLVDRMYDEALAILGDAGYVPYYLYRQKNMLGNLENVGLTLMGHNCLYNIRMMGDRHSIVALGAGSVSKLVFRGERGLERFANAKGVEDYIQRWAELSAQKIGWLTGLE